MSDLDLLIYLQLNTYWMRVADRCVIYLMHEMEVPPDAIGNQSPSQCTVQEFSFPFIQDTEFPSTDAEILINKLS